MHPNAFLKTFWRMELRPQIFVAMDFGPDHQKRFEKVIKPAIESIRINEIPLKAYRVDISQSGDSILTDIVDGIAHSQFVLADVSIIHRDLNTKKPYRNANVMYEVGIALSCRHSSDVLLVHDGIDTNERFLFDVSTIPHKEIDFDNIVKATTELQDALIARLREQKRINDTRIELAIAGLSNDEAILLKQVGGRPKNFVFGRKNEGIVDFFAANSFPRLLDKQLIRLAGEFEDGYTGYKLTPLGMVVAQLVKTNLSKYKADPSPEKIPELVTE